ncbi:MAG: helix-turn-helix domain-containing protein, partial [Polyangiaceae bacterium]|nr:helix-turn-helix domain-containing protein [Polyangiaceae bacterium]
GQSTATGKVRALLGLLEGGLACAAGATRRELPLTQRDIAELLHMRHETVCRALRTIELEDA